MKDPGRPLIGRGRSFLEQILRMAQTRLELLSLELQEEKLALARQLRLAVIGAVCAWLAGLTLVLWIALAVSPEVRFVLLGVLFFVLLIASIVAFVLLRRGARREPLFARLIQQLRADRAALDQELGQELSQEP